MSLEKYISQLLYEHDCVIVPDFGGFVCNYASANINISKNQFHPPYKKISFNRNLKNNDGLLAYQVALEEKISYSDSVCLISEYVSKLNQELRAEKRLQLINIGTFYLGDENTFLFEQDITTNYLPTSFGLNSFYSPTIKREPLERKIEKKFKDKIIVPSKEKTETIPVKRKRSRYLVASAVVVLLALLIWIPVQSGLLATIDYSSLNPFASKATPLYHFSELAMPEDITSSENVTNVLSSLSDTLKYVSVKVDGKIPVVVSLAEDKTTVAKAKSIRHNSLGHFHIIGGAFAISENAEKLVNKLKALGYDAQIIDKKLHMVSYGNFATRKEALAAMEKIRGLQNDAWLMSN